MRSLSFLLVLALAVGCGGGDAKKKTAVDSVDDNDGTDDSKDGDNVDKLVAPKAPTGLTALQAVQGATLSWNPADTATKYLLLRSTTAGSGYAQVYAGTVQNYFDGNLTPGTTYYYVVQAENAAGKSPNSTQAQATALYPIAPAPATVAVVKADAQLRVYWSSSAGAVSYVLQRQTEGGAYVAIATGPTLTNYIDTGVVNGTHYGYRIQVANADGALTASTTATESPYHPGRQFCVPSADGIHVFDAMAETVAAPVRTIAAPRMFTTPTDMAVDTARNILYVLDSLAGRVVAYNTNSFASNPITTPALRTIGVIGATAVTVDTSAGELYVAETGAIRVYNSSGVFVRETAIGDSVNLVAVGGIAFGAGEVFTAHTGGSIRRWNATTMALTATISEPLNLWVPVALEYIGFNDRLAVLTSAGVIRMFNRNSSGAQTANPVRATGYADVRDLAYDSISKQVWMLRSPGSIYNTYAYDVTSLTAGRYFKINESAPLSALEIDSANNRFYAIFGDNTIGRWNTVTGQATYDQHSADARITSSLSGMSGPVNFGVDLTNQRLWVRNTRGFVTAHSLAEGASTSYLSYTFRTPYGFNGDVVSYPALNRFFAGSTSNIHYFSVPFATAVTPSALNTSWSGTYGNLSLSTADNRLYAYDSNPDTFSDVYLRALDADNSDIRGPSMLYYKMPPTTSAGTNAAYGDFSGGGEVVVIDPGHNFGWVFNPTISTVKRVFSLSGATSTNVALVADPVNQEVFVLRNGTVDVYNRNDLKGSGVAPVRSATLLTTADMTVSRDIEMCK